ncbi:hypothetical protein DFH08DRAFT_943401 [Mycena albidolilacea]|uniref:Uncharacterized protein n=1 Tax=Mycena albidolilacea TaxID=1033008 RepID=A0AAD6Z9D8_9AGAR|nr:hypothetical protein DFH08DRAFT_943401 [Mycena albidolilacea]
MGTVASGIQPFACQIILGIKCCKDSEEGAKFGELGAPAYIPHQLAALLFPTRYMHYRCPPLRCGWDLCGRECAIECAVHLGQQFVMVPPLLRHCWWRWQMQRRRISAASSAGKRLLFRFTFAGVLCFCGRAGMCGASAASAEMAVPTPPCIPAVRCDGGDLCGVAYRDAVTTARGARSKCGAAGWVWKAAPAEGRCGAMREHLNGGIALTCSPPSVMEGKGRATGEYDRCAAGIGCIHFVLIVAGNDNDI